MKFIPPKATENFWPRLLELDHNLHGEAQQRDGNFWRRQASDGWTYIVGPDEPRDDHPYKPEDRRRDVFWKGFRLLGGRVVMGMVYIFELVEDNPSVGVLDQPGIGARFTYATIPGPLKGRRSGHVFLTHSAVDSISTYTQEQADREYQASKWAARNGLLLPTPDQYQQLLDELERGASGEFRIFPPAGLPE